MKIPGQRLQVRLKRSTLLSAVIFIALVSQPCHAASPLTTGSTGVTVQPVFGGTILGFDIDPDGTQGLLSEFKFNPDGTILAATEIFDQTTGQIVTVANRTNRHDASPSASWANPSASSSANIRSASFTSSVPFRSSTPSLPAS